MKYWRELLMVIGVCIFTFAASGFSGSVSGSWDNTHEGSLSGEVSYARSDRTQLTLGAALLAIGLVARRRRS